MNKDVVLQAARKITKLKEMKTDLDRFIANYKNKETVTAQIGPLGVGVVYQAKVQDVIDFLKTEYNALEKEVIALGVEDIQMLDADYD